MSKILVWRPLAPIDTEATHLVILTGLSGGGKTVALRTLEDLDFYCVDNLPTGLLPQLVEAVQRDYGDDQRRIAVGVDVRNPCEELEHMPNVLADLAAQGVQVHLIFLDCRDEVLLKRYSETRRRHPLAHGQLSLAEAIAKERQLLRPLIKLAERRLDSSDLNVHQLRRLIATSFARATRGLTLMFQSFAYRHGLPPDADIVFDARCLPNPHWIPTLRPLSGKDDPVKDFLANEPLLSEYLSDTLRWLDAWLPRFDQDDRAYVTIAVGCTGGRHRSVYLVEQLAAHFRSKREGVLLYHRELES